jgi:pimeloyl-ACP methyl ester carboxylesterase
MRKVSAPLFTQQFLADPSTYTPLRSLASNVLDAAGVDDVSRVPQLAQLGPITHLAWGAQDLDLNVRIADFLHSSIPGNTLTILPHTHHNLMIDEPGRFASVILSALSHATAGHATAIGGVR